MANCHQKLFFSSWHSFNVGNPKFYTGSFGFNGFWAWGSLAAGEKGIQGKGKPSLQCDLSVCSQWKKTKQKQNQEKSENFFPSGKSGNFNIFCRELGKMIWPRWPKVCPWFLGIFLQKPNGCRYKIFPRFAHDFTWYLSNLCREQHTLNVFELRWTFCPANHGTFWVFKMLQQKKNFA